MQNNSQPVAVFIIEDDDIDALLMKRNLQTHASTDLIFRARDGQEALEMLAAKAVPSPRIILLDINMPRMNGLEFLSQLRQSDDLKSNVVFIVSSSDHASDITTAYRSQIAGYFKKSTNPSDMVRFVGMLKEYSAVLILPVAPS